MWCSNQYSSAYAGTTTSHQRPAVSAAVAPVLKTVHSISGVNVAQAPLSGSQLSFDEAALTFAKWQYDQLDSGIKSSAQTLSCIERGLGKRPRPDDLVELQTGWSQIGQAVQLRNSMHNYLEAKGYVLSQSSVNSKPSVTSKSSVNSTSRSTRSYSWPTQVTQNFSRPLPPRPQTAPTSTSRLTAPSLRIDTNCATSQQIGRLHSAKVPGRSKHSLYPSPSISQGSITSIPEDSPISQSPTSSYSTLPSTPATSPAQLFWRTPTNLTGDDYRSIRSGSTIDFSAHSHPGIPSGSRGKLTKRSSSVASSRSGRFKDKLHAWSHLHRSQSVATQQSAPVGFWFQDVQGRIMNSEDNFCTVTRTTFYHDAHNLDAEKNKSKGRRLASQALWKMSSVRDHLRKNRG